MGAAVIVALMMFVSAPAQAQAMDKSGVGTAEQVHVSPCRQVEVISTADLELTANEIQLLCGDPRNPPWESIPFYQVRLMARAMLETRGYLQPQFDAKADKITINAGPLVRVSEIRVTGTDFDADLQRYWSPLGKPLTPSVLDQIKAHFEGRLADDGYPCAAVTIEADRRTGFVLVTIDKGDAWTIRKIVSEGIEGLNGKIERRFLAFHEGDDYVATKLRLSSQRLIASGVVLDARFTPRCNLPEKGIVQLDTTVGEPRLFSFGFGFDTENYLMSRILWENSRFGSMASRATFEALLSFRTMRVSAGTDWYYLPFVSRHYLASNIIATRRNERKFRTVEVKGIVSPSWQRDFSRSSLSWRFGPSYQMIKNERGPGRPLTRLVSAEGGVTLMSHDFEYFRASPRSGQTFSYEGQQAFKLAGADLNLSRHHFSSTHLWNLGGWQPPIYVLGFRTDLAALILGPGTKIEDLPGSLRLFLGGMDTIRGFGRNRLPANDFGTLTSAYAGSELRFNEILPYGLQPFIFTDFAMLGAGDKNFTLDKENQYWAPGFGARWESPIGNMRFSLGHGFVNGPKREELQHQEEWQFYFSFGETF